jgi:hypothetical protein
MKRVLALLAMLSLSATLSASTLNGSGAQIPNDPQGAFMAAGGFQTICNDFVLNRVIGVNYPVFRRWYVRMPVETAEAFGFWYFLQATTGDTPTPENDRNRATCAAIGALGTSAALSFSF